MISRSISSLIAAAGSKKASRLCLSCSSEVAPTITLPCATKGRVRHLVRVRVRVRVRVSVRVWVRVSATKGRVRHLGCHGTRHVRYAEARTRTQHVQYVGAWGQAALRRRYVHNAGGRYAQPVRTQRRRRGVRVSWVRHHRMAYLT